jgi:hypothetical protein
MVLAPYAARADVITPLFFDGFDSDTPEVLNATINSWNIPAGSVDVLGGANLCALAGNPSVCVDLDGTGTQAGTMVSKTAFPVSAGTYRLSFDLAGGSRPWMGPQNNTVTVAFGSYYSENITMAMTDPFATYTRDILVGGDGAAYIAFYHYGADWVGLLLDNVSLSHVLIVPDVPNEVPVETPEPATWTLLGGTLALLAWRFRKRHA